MGSIVGSVLDELGEFTIHNEPMGRRLARKARDGLVLGVVFGGFRRDQNDELVAILLDHLG
ncbi:hypothetical protein VW23_021180 [Devosia insulae DS-56]|uniref:Uncharacterized protein n=1 Tax=Devosia insulae DS-56 TaxID=1116389 RepID=A0A1E5XPF0_9HYPH|nr:hypothetical protein VW23_021180 [Devosia insulae DS-56]